jgi:hypothetical protein
MKKIPQRMCVVTREKYDKKDLLRVVRTPQGNVEIDLTGKKNGKGAYIKKDIEVLNKAIKTKALERALDTEIEESVYDKIKEII